MIGVVLWSDNSAGKAVFWCEDQGDLAYYEDPILQRKEACSFDTGDMVQFDITVQRRLRIADNPRLIQEKVGNALPDALRREMGSDRLARDAKTADAASRSAQIIQFAPRKPKFRLPSQLKA